MDFQAPAQEYIDIIWWKCYRNTYSARGKQSGALAFINPCAGINSCFKVLLPLEDNSKWMNRTTVDG